MSNPKSILILGIGQSNFLDQLYGGIKERSGAFAFDIDGYTDISKGTIVGQSDIYSRHSDFKSMAIPKPTLLAAFFHFALTAFFWQIVFFELSQRQSFRRIITQLKKYARAQYIATRHIAPMHCDLVHFHFCTPDNLAYLHFLPDARAICSFWGSDLMRLTGASNVFYVGKALQNASCITLQSDEMAEMLYCKYGRHLRPKVSTLRFTVNPEIFRHIDEQRIGSGAFEFKRSHSIEQSRMVIAIGHNAFEENNHLHILESLEQLELRSELTFVIHASYGAKPEYIARLQHYASQSNLDIRIIQDYLAPRETAQFRCASSIMIHMPVSDALSGAMTEVLYAGNHVIAASWLPYKILKQNGISFTEAADFSVLPHLVKSLLEHQADQYTDSNAEAIRTFLFPDTTSKSWIELLNRVAYGK